MKAKLGYVLILNLALAAGLRAGIIASWNFEDIPAGSEYGTVIINSTTSSVNNLVAVNVAGTNPYYVRGHDNVGHGTAVGILGVAASPTVDSLLSGWTEFNIAFDLRVSAIPTATQAIARYGVTTTAWNIYVQSDGSLHMIWSDASSSFDLNTTAAALIADSQYHNYNIIWNGTSAQILRDGVVQNVEGGVAAAPVTLGAIKSAGATGQLGIGGMVRDNSSVSQEFGGFLDNFVISDTAVIPEPASLSLIVIGSAGVLLLRHMSGSAL